MISRESTAHQESAWAAIFLFRDLGMLEHHLKAHDASVGMRVQDNWGSAGTIRWIGKLDEKVHSFWGKKEVCFFVEYDEESDHPFRSDGEWNGKRYCTCKARCGMMGPASNFFREVNTEGVRQLRKHFGAEVESWHDFELVKFLIARKFDMPAVIRMLEKHLEWRKAFKPSADECFPASMANDYPCGFSHDTDYDGNLIYCERPGNGGLCKASEFVERYTLPTIARWHACGLEMGIRLMRDSNYRHKRLCYMIDFESVGLLNQAMVGFAKTLAQVEQDNYPENLGRVVILNCPSSVTVIWNAIKVFLDARTRKKILFLKPDKAYGTLKEWMAEEVIPDIAGGKCMNWRTTNEMRLGALSSETKVLGTPDTPVGTPVPVSG